MKKINITFCSFPDYSNNARALYKFIKKKNNPKLNLVWIVYNESSVERLRKKGIRAILIGSDEFNDYIPNTDIFFTTQGNLDGDKIKTKKSLYIELWHGIGLKNVGYLCNNMSEQDKKGYNNIRKIVDYFIVPSDFWRVIYSAKMYIEPSRILPIGLPVLDDLKNSNGKKFLAKILGIKLSKFKKIIIYMPTFKKGFNHNDVININTDNIFNFPKYNEKKLDKYLKEHNYLLIVKRHPGEEQTYNIEKTDNIIELDDEKLSQNDLSVTKIINGIDLLITDYSSIGPEFIFLDRPIIYVNTDLESYSKERGIVFDNYDFWKLGPSVKNINELLYEVNNSFSNKNYYKNERKNAKKLYFSDLQNGGCENIYNFIFDKEGNINKHIKYFCHPETKLEKEIENLKEQNKNLDNKIYEINLLNNMLKEEKEKLKLELDDFNVKIQNINTELNNIYNSKSWKCITKIRNLKNKLLKLKK